MNTRLLLLTGLLGLIWQGTNVRGEQGGPTEEEAMSAEVVERAAALIEVGKFAEAEQMLRAQIDDLASPVTAPAAVQLEIMRRTRRDFSLSEQDVLEQLREAIPNVTPDDLRAWQGPCDLNARVIDGELRYFRRGVSNLLKFNAAARARRKTPATAAKKFPLTAHLEQLVELAEASEAREVFPVQHRVRYELTVPVPHPRILPGAKAACWLPFPQEYRQQRAVRLVGCGPGAGQVAPNGSAHRTIYLEQTIDDVDEPLQFWVEYEFVTAADCADLVPEKVVPYDTSSPLYREYTASRPPHLTVSAEVVALAQEIVGDEVNPLEKARLLFRWVSGNIPWRGEREYSTLASLSAKGLADRCGDCGVQGAVFITLCRASGIPARWQSGWETKPNDWNMHDWAEFYLLPWGWLPVDASYGVQDHTDPRVRDFYCGRMDPYRMIVNLDYGQPLVPAKRSFRSEPYDFQRGEIEIDGHNLYYDEWQWSFNVDTAPKGEAGRQ